MIRFLINREKIGLTWEEYETIELAQDGDVKMRRLRPVVARFMVDEKDQPLPHSQALAILGALPMEEVKDVFEQFANAMRESAVPNASGRPLNSDSEASLTPPSPTGAEPSS